MMRIWLVLVIAACGKSGDAGSGSATPPAVPAPAPAPSPTPAGSATSPAAPAPAAGELTGEWSGSWNRTKPVRGGGELHLSVGAKTMLKRVGTACPPEETPATVTVSGNAVKIEVSTDDLKASYTGTRTGDDISGDLTTTCKAGTGTGTWKLSKR